MGFSMNRPNMSISYGGESNKQQKSNLMKDNPVAKHASALNVTEGKKGGLETAKKLKAKKEEKELNEKLKRGPSGKPYAKSVPKEKRMKELGIESPASMKGDPKKFKPKQQKKKKYKI